MSYEDRFLAKLAGGETLSQDEYDQMTQDMPLEIIAAALVKRFRWTEDMRTLIEAAHLYHRAGQLYDALEICSRYPRVAALQRLIQTILPAVRAEYSDLYPATEWIGRLHEEAFLVIHLSTGEITRFPPLVQSTLQDLGE